MDIPAPEAVAVLCERIVALKLLPRTGWLQRGVAPAESVAEHTFGVALLALALAGAAPGVDRGRLLALALVHDLAEALLGDWPASARPYLGADAKLQAERGALSALLAGLPQREEYLALWEEYAAASSREARLVKALDRLEMLAQALAYERAGSRALGEFWQGAAQGWEEFPALGAVAAHLAALRP
ncbi:MAG TPA: HD domain-containing protein [Roseiflexaceae bacterium]|nr:HD domain-containing protein [Roseiflexaceae bacterium]